MPESAYIKDSLNRRVLFFTGKGGVGKTSIAWATALALKNRGKRVRVVSWNPFETPKALMDKDLQGIDWLPLTTLGTFKEYALRTLKFEKVYNMVFENAVLKAFIKAAPGLSDSVLGGKIWDLYDTDAQDHLIVDLPASGHALSFFKSPLGVEKIFKMGFVHRDVQNICQLYGSKESRIDLVALPEELPLEECRQLKDKLTELHSFHFGFLHINQCHPQFDLPDPSELTGDVKAWVERSRSRRKHQAQAMEIATQIKLPQIEIPRLAPGERSIVATISDTLGAA